MLKSRVCFRFLLRWRREGRMDRELMFWHTDQLALDNIEERNFILQQLRDFIQLRGSNVEVFEYGSGPSGTAIWNSDINLCVTPINQVGQEEKEDILIQIFYELLRSGIYETDDLSIPDLALVCSHVGILADISVHDDHHEESLTCQYLRYVTDGYEISKVLICLVKSFMYAQNLNTRAVEGGIKNIVATYMVIYYLQKGGYLPVVLQMEKPHTADAFHLEAQQYLQNPPLEGTTKSLNRWFKGFFKFYGEEFDFGENVINIRSNVIMRKQQLNWQGLNYHLAVLDPFKVGENHDNLAVNVEAEHLVNMRMAFRRAARELARGQVGVLFDLFQD